MTQGYEQTLEKDGDRVTVGYDVDDDITYAERDGDRFYKAGGNRFDDLIEEYINEGYELVLGS